MVVKFDGLVVEREFMEFGVIEELDGVGGELEA